MRSNEDKKMDKRGDWTIEISDNTVFVVLSREDLSEQSALGLSSSLIHTLKTSSLRRVVVDYRDITKDWPVAVDRVWIQLMETLPDYVDRCAALCHNPTLKLENNYIFRQVGAHDKFRAFSSEEINEASEFIGYSLGHPRG